MSAEQHELLYLCCAILEGIAFEQRLYTEGVIIHHTSETGDKFCCFRYEVTQ